MTGAALDDKERGVQVFPPLADAFRYHLGNRYNRTKKSHGGERRAKAQTEPLKTTAEKLAEEHGVNESTVRRAGKFAEEIDYSNCALSALNRRRASAPVCDNADGGEQNTAIVRKL